jgi:hypothetical protein
VRRGLGGRTQLRQEDRHVGHVSRYRASQPCRRKSHVSVPRSEVGAQLLTLLSRAFHFTAVSSVFS